MFTVLGCWVQECSCHLCWTRTKKVPESPRAENHAVTDSHDCKSSEMFKLPLPVKLQTLPVQLDPKAPKILSLEHRALNAYESVLGLGLSRPSRDIYKLQVRASLLLPQTSNTCRYLLC